MGEAVAGRLAIVSASSPGRPPTGLLITCRIENLGQYIIEEIVAVSTAWCTAHDATQEGLGSRSSGLPYLARRLRPGRERSEKREREKAN